MNFIGKLKKKKKKQKNLTNTDINNPVHII